MLAGDAPKWRARDDVYQVGQLLAMLVKGDARERVRTHEVRRLACSDELKEIVYRCIGERRKRYESADDLIAALGSPPARLAVGALRTLKGAHIAFTGILSDAAPRGQRAPRSGPAPSSTGCLRPRRPSSCAAGRIRCRQPDAKAG